MELAKINLFLSEQRREQGMSQTEIAEALNVEQATVSLYENGKRGIPLELLDPWFKVLGVEVKLNTRGNTPVKTPEETMNDLEVFEFLKRRRNYLIPEMRAMVAEKIMQEPLFRKTDAETGENLFWPYSFGGEAHVGVVETRYDHPEQKFLAVEYTEKEVNLYRFLPEYKAGEAQSRPKWLQSSRVFFSEDDFLTLGGQWDRESMEACKVTILRQNSSAEDGVELVAARGFSLRALTEMHHTFLRLKEIVHAVWENDAYQAMDKELESINTQLQGLMLDNRYENGAMNPDFMLWSEIDKAVIDVPLWAEKRNWHWIHEGEEWCENEADMIEVQVYKDEVVYNELNAHKYRVLYTHKHADGSRVIGLLGEEGRPAVFMGSLHKPGTLYRVEIEPETLSSKEQAQYLEVLKATKELHDLRKEVQE